MNCIYFLPCFCSDSNGILNKLSCLVHTWFQYLYINSKDGLNYIWTPIENLLSLSSKYQVKFYNFYPYLSLKTVFSVLKLTKICCINIYEHFFFLENWQFNYKLTLLHIYQAWKRALTIWQNIKVSATQKKSIFQLFSELGEIWKYSLS